jgi:hypothetical protein
MTSSGFALSAHNSDLIRKFQGNGWALTCSTASQNELSEILGDNVSAASDAPTACDLPDFPLPEYETDWADIVFEPSAGWRAVDGFAPLWLAKATEGADCALFQLPPPDHRWVVKFAGEILEPFDYRKEGWKELHEIMVHGCLLDRADLLLAQSQKHKADPFTTVADLGRGTVDLLKRAELIRAVNNQEYGQHNQRTDEIHCSVSGARISGLDTQTAKGEIEPDRWQSCADDFNKQLRDRLDRVFNAIKRKDELAAAMIRKAVRLRNGQWSFTDSVQWMTSLGEIPYDCSMVLNGKTTKLRYTEAYHDAKNRNAASSGLGCCFADEWRRRTPRPHTWSDRALCRRIRWHP